MISQINVNGETYSIDHNLLGNLPDNTVKFLPSVSPDDENCVLCVNNAGAWEITPITELSKVTAVTTSVDTNGDITLKKGDDSILFSKGKTIMESQGYDEDLVMYDDDTYYAVEIHMPSITTLRLLKTRIIETFGLSRYDYDINYLALRVLDIPNCVGVAPEWDYLGYDIDKSFPVIESVVVNTYFTSSSGSRNFFATFICDNIRYEADEFYFRSYRYSVKEGEKKVCVTFFGAYVGTCSKSSFIDVIAFCDYQGEQYYSHVLKDLFDVCVPDSLYWYFNDDDWCDGEFVDAVYTHPVNIEFAAKIVFVNNDGSRTYSSTGLGGTAYPPPYVYKQGYTFLGWGESKYETLNSLSDNSYIIVMLENVRATTTGSDSGATILYRDSIPVTKSYSVYYPFYAKLEVDTLPYRTRYSSGEKIYYGGLDFNVIIGNDVNGFSFSWLDDAFTELSPNQGIMVVSTGSDK